MMTYQEALNHLKVFAKFGSKPGLHRMQKILSFLGDPHKSLKCVHVTGTDGKGSTSAMTASILSSAGYKTGLFTSPHLHRYNERIKVDDLDISDAEFVHVFEKVNNILIKNKDIEPALFELITVMAFLYFSEKNVDAAVIEVGLGGQLDSTNVIDGLVCAITNVNLEHAALFGGTRESIALEKSGIIKANSFVVISEQDELIQAIFTEEADKKGATLEFVSESDIQLEEQALEGQIFSFRDFKNLEIPLLGQHQLLNASLAASCAQALNKYGFNITKSHIQDGLKNVRWPLRLEIVHHEPGILIDVAHNPFGIKAIKQSIESVFPKEHRILVLGCSFDKPYQEMAKALSGLADVIILTKAKYHGVDPKKLADAIDSDDKKIYETSSVKEAMILSKKLSSKESLIMVLGGLYLGAEAKECVEDIFGL